MASNTNPGNFANRSHDEVSNLAKKGGQVSHSGGFASMDSSKQRNIASQGGQASSGSFQPGDPRARAAGQKGGSRTQYDYDQNQNQIDEEDFPDE
ncbi:hypothetical protein BO70DRAFT_426388 [Aspergillus heteromorphus CBS 117.55]|uniref:Conidiation-specific protein (Con-10) n=1 Tax=Aspergillus heteromorphus CBS 117.55 TaxID=1448321 RepID=A0A317WUH0_9EURO|nr:uncharacterized protein BO70DRAFT_426388 [Aspergillus heteromorphus CBS 117.55]PWY89989.1 hypothetical protein BO70DRAFT_426388 [Aspergillus heteromorphus CBS 117.55]